MDTNKKWRMKNHEKYRAHMIIRNEIEYGRLTPQKCEMCGNDKAHAHHGDYSKPLEVRWLCTVCHRKHHAIKSGQQIHDKKEKKIPYKAHHKHYQPAPKRDSLLNKAKALREKGLSYKQISDTLNVSKGTVYKWLNEVSYK